ncbi:SseB protein N-terminal domain-containing protein [Micrococcales bacterium KH10]|nr:SseB protein N-terminal domain-containing protein [Micrococcales bacterium KH10]
MMHHPFGGHERCDDEPGLGGDGKQMPPTSAFADDDGSADEVMAELLTSHQRDDGSMSAIVERLRDIRVLIPMMAELVQDSLTSDGLQVDKEAATGIVAVATGDGRTALPVFTSMDAMKHWHPQARPVPVVGARAALASVAEGWSLLVVDPAGPCPAIIPRPAVWAMAQQQPWQPIIVGGTVIPEVAEHIRQIVQESSHVVQSVTCLPDKTGPERIVVQLQLVEGLTQRDLDGHIARINHALSASSIVAERIDAVALKLVRG